MTLAPTPITWVDNVTFLSAANLNTEIRDAITFLLAPPRAVLRRVAAQSVATGTSTPTAVSWDTEDLDTFNGFSSGSPTRYTAQVAGRYNVQLVIDWAANATGTRVIAIAINGGTSIILATQTNVGAGSDTIQVGGFTIPWVFAVGDYFVVNISHSAGVTINHASTANSYLTVQWIGK